MTFSVKHNTQRSS